MASQIAHTPGGLLLGEQDAGCGGLATSLKETTTMLPSDPQRFIDSLNRI